MVTSNTKPTMHYAINMLYATCCIVYASMVDETVA